MQKKVKISFGIIVLNGEPFTRYCLRGIYPYAYQIIIVEGACKGARTVANADGHSSDETLVTLQKFKSEEDPENKITVVTAEDEGHPNGFWPGEKDEQSKAYAKRATGDYLWQVDIDEFYKDEDIIKIIDLLKNEPGITAVSFKQLQFWGGFRYIVDSWYLRRGMEEFHRLFKWGEGYIYEKHRPPTVLDNKGKNTRDINWKGKKFTSSLGIYLYHYSFIFPKQVREKALYYRDAEWSKRKRAEWWSEDVFMKLKHPYNVFSIYWVPSWLKRYNGQHPEIIYTLIDDINNGRVNVEVRRTDDIEKLTGSIYYNIGVFFLKCLDPLDENYRNLKRKLKKIIKKLLI